MKLTIVLAAAALCAMPLAASAQWQWIDKDGRKVFSDQAPPPDIPDKSIVRKPVMRIGAPAPVATAAPVAAASGPAAAASAPRLTGVDDELQERTRQAKQAEELKAKQEADRIAKMKVENCARAKEAKAALDSGTRIARTNAKGEREFLDDAGRNAEAKRIQAVMASECKG